MPVKAEEITRSPIDMEKCEKAEDELLGVLNKNNLSLRELIYLLAKTLIDVGGTIEGVKKKLTFDDMRKQYAMEPTLGNALMAFGTDVLSEWLKIPEKEEKK